MLIPNPCVAVFLVFWNLGCFVLGWNAVNGIEISGVTRLDYMRRGAIIHRGGQLLIRGSTLASMGIILSVALPILGILFIAGFIMEILGATMVIGIPGLF